MEKYEEPEELPEGFTLTEIRKQRNICFSDKYI